MKFVYVVLLDMQYETVEQFIGVATTRAVARVVAREYMKDRGWRRQGRRDAWDRKASGEILSITRERLWS